jgi:hypothetical protein
MKVVLRLQNCGCTSYLGTTNIQHRKRPVLEQLMELGLFPATPERFVTLVSLDILEDRYRRFVHDKSRMNGFVRCMEEAADLVCIPMICLRGYTYKVCALMIRPSRGP